MTDVLVIPRGRRGPRVLFELMATQHGVASSIQARELGVSRSVEQRLVAEGALVRVLPGVLAAGGVRPTFAAQAMAATLRPGVLGVSHGAAARLHRLPGFDHHAIIDVLGRRSSHIRGDESMLAHYSRGPIEQHIIRVAGIPVTSIPLTLTLVVAVLTRLAAISAITDALNRGVPAADIRSVALQWRDPGRTGPSRLLELLDRIAGGRSHSA